MKKCTCQVSKICRVSLTMEKAPVAITGALSELGYSQTQRNRMIDTVQLRPSNLPDEYYLFNGRDPIMRRNGQPARVRIR